jgi:hypothetical protein
MASIILSSPVSIGCPHLGGRLFRLAWEFDCTRINDQHTKLKRIKYCVLFTGHYSCIHISALGLMTQYFLAVSQKVVKMSMISALNGASNPL